MKHHLFFSLLALTLSFCFVSCQSSEQVISNAVERLNKSCPFKTSKTETIEKVDFLNHDVIFYVTDEESEISFDDYTFAQLRGLESNYSFRLKTMEIYLNNYNTVIAFQRVTLSNADDVDLNFKVISKVKEEKVCLRHIVWN